MNLATTNRREESDFVPRMKQGVPRSEFLIAGSHNGRAVLGQLGNALRVRSEELLDSGSVSNVQRFLELADNVLQAAKEQHLDADGL